MNHLEFLDAVEACARVAGSEIRRFVRATVRADAGDNARNSLRTTATVSDVSHEIGGLYSLLPHMIKEISNSRRQGSKSRVAPCAAIAARRLFRVAEHWQSLSFLRQRVA